LWWFIPTTDKTASFLYKLLTPGKTHTVFLDTKFAFGMYKRISFEMFLMDRELFVRKAYNEYLKARECIEDSKNEKQEYYDGVRKIIYVFLNFYARSIQAAWRRYKIKCIIENESCFDGNVGSLIADECYRAVKRCKLSL
jgi:hypothetical protein